MTDNVDRQTRSRIMAAVRSRDTKPEVAVREAMKRLRVRFSIGTKELPGNPDIVIPGLKLAIFVNGCFWHWHGCKRSRMPQANEAYWQRKIEGNIRRDRRNRRLLSALGWRSCTVWECSIGRGMARVESRVKSLRQALEF